MSTGKVHSENTASFKTRAQVEFGDLFRELGWKPADVARALHVSRSAVTMILQGERNPRMATLEGLKTLVGTHRTAKERGEAIEHKFNDKERMQDQLQFLREKSPARYEAAKMTVDALHRQAVEESGAPREVILHKKGRPKPHDPSSILTAEEKEASKKLASDLHAKRVSSSSPESSQLPGADVPHPHKGPPRKPSSSGSKPPPPTHSGKDRT